MSEDLPRSVTEFIRRYIVSVEQLEILLLLRAAPDEAWTPEQVAQELYTQPDSALRRLDQLAGARLVVASRGRYRYEPESIALANDLEEVAGAYTRRRHRVITEIFSDPPDPPKSLSDAFRIRPPDR